MTTLDDFAARLYDALVATLERECEANDEPAVLQCRAAIQAITHLLGEPLGRAARDQAAVDDLVERISDKIRRIASEAMAKREDQTH